MCFQKCGNELYQLAHANDEFINTLKQQNRDTQDSLVLRGLADLLHKNVAVITVNTEDRSVSEMVFKSSNKTHATLYIGHIKDKHFVALKRKEHRLGKRKSHEQSKLDCFFSNKRAALPSQQALNQLYKCLIP